MAWNNFVEIGDFEEFIRRINRRDTTALDLSLGIDLERYICEELIPRRKRNITDLFFSYLHREKEKYKNSKNGPLKTLSSIPELESIVGDRETFSSLGYISDFVRNEFISPVFTREVFTGILSGRYDDVKKKIFGDVYVPKADDNGIFHNLFFSKEYKPKKDDERLELESLLESFGKLGFRRWNSRGGFVEGNIDSYFLELGLKNVLGLSTDEKDFVQRFDMLFHEYSDDLAKNISRNKLRDELKKYLYKKVDFDEKIPTIEAITTRINSLGGPSLIRKIQEKGIELFKYMLEGNSSAALKSERYGYLSDVLGANEQFTPIDRWTGIQNSGINLVIYASKYPNLVKDLLEHTIYLCDFRLEKGKLFYRNLGNARKINGSFVIKGGEYPFATLTKKGYLRFGSLLINELLRVDSVKDNKEILYDLFANNEFINEIAGTKRAEERKNWLGAGYTLLGGSIPVIYIDSLGIIITIGGAFCTIVGYSKKKYTGIRVHTENFQFGVKKEAKPKSGLYGLLERVCN